MSLLRAFASARGPSEFAAWLIEQGPVFVKFGQFLAMRPDLIPQEYCDELLGLLDEVPGFPWEVARQILEEDLGEPPERGFGWIDPVPEAAGSLAQVHFARTHDGREVAVKVQRPDIRRLIDRGLRRIVALARALSASGAKLAFAPLEVTDELRRWLDEELDFRRELSNIQTLYDAHARRDPWVTPRPHPSLSGPRVVTCDLLRGVRLTSVLELVIRKDAKRLDALGVDPDDVAKCLMESVLTQAFRRGRFHADPHPGNLLVLSNSRIGFIDYGLVARLDDTVREGLARYIGAVYEGNAERMSHGVIEILVPGPNADADALRRSLVDATHEWQRRRDDWQGAVDERSPTADYLVSVVRLAKSHGFQMPPGVLALYRALLTAETLAARLSARENLRSIGRGFFSRLQLDLAIDDYLPEKVLGRSIEMAALLKDGPGQVHRLLADLADDRLALRVRTQESPEDRRAANDRTRLLVAGALSIGIAVLLAAVQWVRPLDRWLAFPIDPLLGAALLASYGWIAVLWRRLR